MKYSPSPKAHRPKRVAAETTRAAAMQTELQARQETWQYSQVSQFCRSHEGCSASQGRQAGAKCGQTAGHDWAAESGGSKIAYGSCHWACPMN